MTEYILAAGRSCPMCGCGGLFNVEDEENEIARGAHYRCEGCLTRFDANKVPLILEVGDGKDDEETG